MTSLNTKQEMSVHMKLSVGLLACVVGFVAISIGEETSDIPADLIFNLMTVTRRYQACLCSIVGTILVGLSGIFPLIVVPTEAAPSLHHGVAASTLRLLLSFAVGSLLGDVFLHLLPEAWHLVEKNSSYGHLSIGFWVLIGIFSFIIIEAIFSRDDLETQASGEECLYSARDTGENNNYKAWPLRRNDAQEDGRLRHSNGYHNGNGATHFDKVREGTIPVQNKNTKHIAGYLNLFANCVDNFSHGLSVAGSFLVSFKVGALTTFAILIHEIPHEIGDFAILLKSGFNRWEAAKAQVITASVGLLGAVAALCVDSTGSLGASTVWILPFTAGGFLNIALVNVLPDLLKERDKRECFKQLVCMCAGVATMGLVTVFVE